ncbi:MAG: hypothetical protein H7Z37_02860, partial [Pyrinomonadaceae bacterium]|nr:hypothetical protein [Pyrinomonadaceae bacterium]
MKININSYLAILICFFAVIINGKAATFTVENLNNDGAGSLRQAITDSNAAAGADIVNVNITGSVLLLTSLPTIIEGLTINGNSQNGFIVDGQNTSGVCGFSVNGTTVPGGFVVNINNLTVTRGNATNLGGGIRVEGGATLNLTNVNVNSNTSVGAGGLYATSAATLNVLNSRVINNIANGAGGDGGGVSISGATLFMSGTTVSGNTIPTSGGSTGGGVNIVGNATNASLVRIENSTISGNTGEFGGGIYNSASSGSSTLRISNVTVSGNTSGSNGGGIFASGIAVIRNSTIAGNTANGAGAGGGIYATGTPTITLGNTIVADNSTATTPSTSAEIRANGTFQTVGTNIIEGSSSGAITVLNGANITGVDPQLTALADNGGTVFTRSFQTGSNAINAGANSESLNTSETPAALTTDSRGTGFARITGSSVDVGAFEFGSVLTVVSRRAFDFDG